MGMKLPPDLERKCLELAHLAAAAPHRLAIGPVRVCATLALRTVNTTNAREHWATRSRRVKAEHEAVAASLIGYPNAWRERLAAGCVCTLTRVSAGTLDGDGLAAALKGVRDAVAVWLLGGRIGERDSDPRITWVCDQRPGKRNRPAVIVEIEPRGDR